MNVTEERRCAIVAMTEGQDPIGSAGTVGRLLAMEMPAPWSTTALQAEPTGSIQQQIRAAQMDYAAQLRATGEMERVLASGYPGIYGIAPDSVWSEAGTRRVLLALRPDGPFAAYELREYAFPFDSPALVDLARAYLMSPRELGALDGYRVEHPGIPEFFVCTHGQVDACCATFGVPLYRQARDAYPAVRAWRTTHFGGHRYAPTAWEFPSGLKWAFLDPEAATAVIERSEHPAALRSRLRGWSGVPGPAQLLDREGLIEHGWDWLGYKRYGEVLDERGDGEGWRVRLSYVAPGGDAGVYEAEVGVRRNIEVLGCGRDWGAHPYNAREYQIERLSRFAPATGERVAGREHAGEWRA